MGRENKINEYEKALVILRESSTPKSKNNALIKLSVTTSDQEFKELIDAAARGYSYYIKPGYSRNAETLPCNHTTWLEYMVPLKKELKEYCESMLAAKKPQWQVLAERNGWIKSTP